jgi:hypothetical protein
MQLSVVLTQAAIWLREEPEVMLSTNVRSLSRSAKARLSERAPLAANVPEPGTVAVDSGDAHACVPLMWTGPE